MAINDLNRIRRVYSFYRPRPVPITTSADTGGSGGGGPCDCPAVLGDINYIAEDANVPTSGTVSFVTTAPGAGQIQVIDGMRNIHSRRVEHALTYVLPLDNNLTPGTTIEILNTGGQNSYTGSLDAFSVFSFDGPQYGIVPRGSDFVAVYDHTASFGGDNQWRMSVTDPGPHNQVINIPTLTGSTVTLSYQPSTVTGSVYPLIGFDNVVYFTALPSSSFNVVVDNHGPIPACRLWLVNKSEGLMNVDDGNVNSDAGIVGNWALLTNEGKFNGVDHPWFVAAGSQIGPGIVTLLHGFHDFISAPLDQNYNITYGSASSPSYLPINAVRNIIEPASGSTPRTWFLDGVQNSGSIYDGAEVVVSNTNASNISVQGIGFAGGFNYAYTLATVPGLCAGSFVWSPDLNLWRFEGLSPYSLTVSAPTASVGSGSINYIPENAAVPAIGNVFFVTTAPGAGQIQVIDSKRNIHSRRVDGVGQLVYYMPSDTTLTPGTTIEVLNTGYQKDSFRSTGFYDAFAVTDALNTGTIYVVPPGSDIVCTYDHSFLGANDNQWRYTITDPAINDVTLVMTGSASSVYRFSYEPKQLSTVQKVSLRGFHNVVRIAPTGSNYEIVLDSNLIPQSAEVTIVNSGPKRVLVAYAGLEAGDLGALASLEGASLANPSWATFTSDNFGTSVNGVWRLTQYGGSGSFGAGGSFVSSSLHYIRESQTNATGSTQLTFGTAGVGQIHVNSSSWNILAVRGQSVPSYILPVIDPANLPDYGTIIEFFHVGNHTPLVPNKLDSITITDSLVTQKVVLGAGDSVRWFFDENSSSYWRFEKSDHGPHFVDPLSGSNSLTLTFEKSQLFDVDHPTALFGSNNIIRVAPVDNDMAMTLDNTNRPEFATCWITNQGTKTVIVNGDDQLVELPAQDNTDPLSPVPGWGFFAANGFTQGWELVAWGPQSGSGGGGGASFSYLPESAYAMGYGTAPYFGNVRFVPGIPGNGELQYTNGVRNIHPTRVDLDVAGTQLTYYLPSASNLTPGTTIELLNASGQSDDLTKTRAFDAFIVTDPLNTGTIYVVPPNANFIATYDHSFLGTGDNQWRYSIVDPTIYDTSLEIGGNTVGNIYRLTYEPLLMSTTQKVELKGFHNVVRVGTTGSFEIVLDSNLIPQSAEVTIVNSGSSAIPIFYAGLEAGDLGQLALLDGATNPLFPSWATFTSNNFGGINGVWKLTQYGSTGSIAGSSSGGDRNATYILQSATSSLPNSRRLVAGVGILLTDAGAGGDLTITNTALGSGSSGGGADANASYVVMGLTGSLLNERVLTAGNGIQITDGGANNPVTIINRAPFDMSASYVVLGLTSSLSNERVLTAGTGILLTDGGANGNATVGINNNVVATISGSRFTGAVIAAGGLTGSLQQTSAGASYLVASSSNISISSASSGQVFISSNQINIVKETLSNNSGIVQLVWDAPTGNQVKVIRDKWNILSVKVSSSCSYILPIYSASNPTGLSTVIELIHVGPDTNSTPNNLDAITITDSPETIKVRIGPQNSARFFFDHVPAGAGDKQWRYELTDHGPHVINPLSGSNNLTLTYQKSQLVDADNGVHLYGATNVLLVAPTTADMTVTLDNDNCPQYALCWIKNAGTKRVDVDDGSDVATTLAAAPRDANDLAMPTWALFAMNGYSQSTWTLVAESDRNRAGAVNVVNGGPASKTIWYLVTSQSAGNQVLIQDNRWNVIYTNPSFQDATYNLPSGALGTAGGVSSNTVIEFKSIGSDAVQLVASISDPMLTVPTILPPGSDIAFYIVSYDEGSAAQYIARMAHQSPYFQEFSCMGGDANSASITYAAWKHPGIGNTVHLYGTDNNIFRTNTDTTAGTVAIDEWNGYHGAKVRVSNTCPSASLKVKLRSTGATLCTLSASALTFPHYVDLSYNAFYSDWKVTGQG